MFLAFLQIRDVVMSSGSKFPIERRRRDSSSQQFAGDSVLRDTSHMRRESDLVKARLQRWVELADTALGRPHRDPHPHKH
jgi:hypothetical protein